MSARVRLVKKISPDWLSETATQEMFELLALEGGQGRVVGGAVRDGLQKIAAGDIDFATTHLPEKVSELAIVRGHNVYPTGIEHGTVTVVIYGRTFEVTTLRHDVRTDGRHAQVRFGTDWVVDAQRRDFTMNAIYCDADGTLFDPLEGQADCLAGRVQFIGEARDRIAEDYLRIYRYFRFCATHGKGKLDDDIVAICLEAAPHRINLAPERIATEMLKLLACEKIAVILNVMAQGDLISVGVADKKPQTALKRYDGLLKELDAMLLPVEDRLALLLAANAVTTTELSQGWRLPNRLVNTAHTLAEFAGFARGAGPQILKYRAGENAVRARILAYALGYKNKAELTETVKALAKIDQPQFPLRGSDLLGAGMRPGEAIGSMLTQLEGKWIASDFKLDRKELLHIKRDILARG